MSSQPPRQALAEALTLGGEIIRNIELSELRLAVIALKASRLARLIGDTEMQTLFSLEAGGYSAGPGGVPADHFQLALKAGRRTTGFHLGQMNQNLVWTESIEQLEAQVEASRITLSTTQGSAQPTPPGSMPTLITPPTERGMATSAMANAAGRVASRRKLVYDYALRIYYELRFSGIADDVFTRVRNRVDASIGEVVPDAVQKLASAYDNLQSDNPEDWSNAVHSCRRILQALADRLLPPTSETHTIQVDGKDKVIHLGADQYINRLIRFAELRSASNTFANVVGSHLRFLGDRLDAVFDAAHKGSHSVVGREDADRFVVYTYLLVGDLLTLVETARR
jgi:hypothetical protein